MAVKSNLKKRLPSRLMQEPFAEDKFEDLLVFGYAARIFDGNDERARYVDQVRRRLRTSVDSRPFHVLYDCS